MCDAALTKDLLRKSVGDIVELFRSVRADDACRCYSKNGGVADWVERCKQLGPGLSNPGPTLALAFLVYEKKI